MMVFLVTVGSFAESINLHLLTPSFNSEYNFVEGAKLHDLEGNDSRLYLGAFYNYIDKPLVFTNPSRTRQLGSIYERMHTLDLTAGRYFNQRFFLGVGTSLHKIDTSAGDSEFTNGDTRFIAKLRMTSSDSPIHAALMPYLSLPTGDPNYFLSDSSVGGGLSLLLEKEFTLFKVTGNAGYRYYADSIVQDMDYRNRIPWGVGVTIPVALGISISGEYITQYMINSYQYHQPDEFHAAGHWKLTKNISASLGASMGAVDGVGSSDFRLVAGIRIFPISKKSSPRPKKVSSRKRAPKKGYTYHYKRVIFTPRRVRLLEEIKFKHDSDVITKSGRELINEVAFVLRKHRKMVKSVLIMGHANKLGTRRYNEKLSHRRSRSVREYLVSRGISPKILKVLSYGERRPKHLPHISRKAQLAANRRVEFIVDSVKKKIIRGRRKR